MTWRRAGREERQLAILWGIAAAAALLLRPFWLAVAPLLPGCPFRAVTGVPCPSCGTTHAAIALLDGRLGAALAANPLAALAGLAFAAGVVVVPIWAIAGWPMPELPAVPPRRARAALIVVLLAGWAWVIVAAR